MEKLSSKTTEGKRAYAAKAVALMDAAEMSGGGYHAHAVEGVT